MAALLALTCLPLSAQSRLDRLSDPIADDERAALQRDFRTERTRLAIGGFSAAADLDPRDVWMTTALEESLAWRLRRTAVLITIPTVRLHQAGRELLDETGATCDWPRAARCLGATLFATGRVSGPPERLVLELTLAPPGQAESAAAATARFGPDRFVAVLDAATRWLLERCAAGPIADPLPTAILDPPSASLSAIEHYARAVAAARAENSRDALYFAGTAVEYDVRFRPALLLLAQMELRASPAARVNAVRRLRALNELSRLAGDPIDRADSEMLLGLVAQLGGSPDAAMTRFETALLVAHEFGDPYTQLAAMNALADGALAASTPGPDGAPEPAAVATAAEWQRLALGGVVLLGDIAAQPPAASKLALLHERRGDAAAAGPLHERTLACAQEIGTRRGQATAWLLLGQWLARQKRHAEGQQALERCLELADARSQPAVRMALGELYQSLDPPRPREAIEQYETALRQLRSGDDLLSQLICLREAAMLRMLIGERDAALRTLQEAIDLAEALESPVLKRLLELREVWNNAPR